MTATVEQLRARLERVEAQRDALLEERVTGDAVQDWARAALYRYAIAMEKMGYAQAMHLDPEYTGGGPRSAGSERAVVYCVDVSNALRSLSGRGHREFGLERDVRGGAGKAALRVLNMLYFAETGWSVTSIAVRLRVSRELVRRLHTRALDMVYEILAPDYQAIAA